MFNYKESFYPKSHVQNLTEKNENLSILNATKYAI